jgi:beta-galactosidase
MWRVLFEPGTLRAVARSKGKSVLTQEIRTADEPAAIILIPDRRVIKSDGSDLSFVTVKVVDRNGTVVPYADNMVRFEVAGEGLVASVDNGSQTSHEPFKASYRKAFNGMCLAILQSKGKPGRITLKAVSDGLKPASVTIEAK